jgi:hypothetical protein
MSVKIASECRWLLSISEDLLCALTEGRDCEEKKKLFNHAYGDRACSACAARLARMDEHTKTRSWMDMSDHTKALKREAARQAIRNNKPHRFHPYDL